MIVEYKLEIYEKGTKVIEILECYIYRFLTFRESQDKDLVGTKAVLTDMVCAFTCIIMTTLFIESIRKQMEKFAVKIYDNVLWLRKGSEKNKDVV